MSKMQVLPLDCEAYYQPGFLTREQCNQIFKEVTDLGIASFIIAKNTRWGKIMFMDSDLFENNLLPQEAWGKTSIWVAGLDRIAQSLSELLNWPFHTGVAIYYPDGEEGVDFHTDYPAFGDTSIIASLSLGAERTFQLRHKTTGNVFSKRLEEGSLIVMGHDCQDKYEHALPIDPNCKEPRLNITFRRFGCH